MHRLEWDDALLTGDALVDDQHRRIYALVRELAEIVEQGGDRERTADALYGILRYVGTHFGDEESLMERIGYPELEEQRRLHDGFRTKAADLVEDFLADEDVSAQYLLGYVLDWVHDHVNVEDLKLARFIGRGEDAGFDGGYSL